MRYIPPWESFCFIQPTQCWFIEGKTNIHKCDNFYQNWKNKSAWGGICCAKYV